MATDKKSSAVPESDPWRVVTDFAPHLRIAHQIAGRVRLKLDVTALDEPALRALGVGRLKQALAAVRGVHAIQLNPLALSCTINYDSLIVPDAAWPDLLAGRRTPAAATLLDLLVAAAFPSHRTHRTTRRKEKTP